MGSITLNLPEELIASAKAEAARRGGTLDSYVRELLEEKVDSEDKAVQAVKNLIALAAEGPFFEGDPRSISRDELHERRR